MIDAHWKERSLKEPWIVSKVFENGFKNPWGCWALGGTWGLPFWICLFYLATPGSYWSYCHLTVAIIWFFGRIVCQIVEWHLMLNFFYNLDKPDLEQKQK